MRVVGVRYLEQERSARIFVIRVASSDTKRPNCVLQTSKKNNNKNHTHTVAQTYTAIIMMS